MEYSSLAIITEPAVEPITHEDVKPFLKIDSAMTTDDTLLDFLCKAARQAAETFLRRGLITQKWKFALDDQPDEIELPLAPIISVDEVNVVAEGGVETVQTVSLYETKLGENGMVWLRSGCTWGSTIRLREMMNVEFTVGYGPAAVNVPGPIIDGLKRMVVYLYEHRGDDSRQVRSTGISGPLAPEGVSLVVDSGAYGILFPYKVLRMF